MACRDAVEATLETPPLETLPEALPETPLETLPRAIVLLTAEAALE